MARQDRADSAVTVADPSASFMPLEQRAMLNGLPFPALNDLENPTHTVVRIETTIGDVDIELFDNDAPVTVSNFLRLIREGSIDQSLLHRLDPGFILQGGGFRYNDTAGMAAAPNFGPIPLEFNRSNVERTIGMARTNNPNSATNQFFFNLANNAQSLDRNPNQNNDGYAVFGRVIQGWSVITTIAGLTRYNMPDRNEPASLNAPPMAPIDADPRIGAGEFASAFREMPVTSNYNYTTGATEAALVVMHNIEIIKPQGSTAFYTQQIYYAEGFAGSTINEFLPMVNPNSFTAHYQVVARFENGLEVGRSRDKVLAAGVLAPGARGGITIFKFDDVANALVEQGRPYALEIHTTAEIGATLSHYDFGTSTGEAFTPTTSATWAFGDATKAAANIFDFLLWQNPNSTAVTVNIKFYYDDAEATSITQVTPAYRRGGLNLSEVPSIPNGKFSIIISASDEIVASLTHFDSAAGRTGSTSIGVEASSSYGVIPIAYDGATSSHMLSVINPGSTVALLNIRLVFTDNARPDLELPARLLIAPGLRKALDLSTIPQIATDGSEFTLIFHSTAPVYAQSTHVDFTDNANFTDDVSDPVATRAGTRFHYAEGFMDPVRAGVNVFELVSVFNPNSAFFNVASEQTAVVTLTFRYTDGFAFNKVYSVEPGRRLAVDLHALPEILEQGTANQRFFYSMEVSSNVNVVSEMWHFDLTLGGLSPSGGFATLGTPVGATIPLDNLGGGTPG